MSRLGPSAEKMSSLSRFQTLILLLLTSSSHMTLASTQASWSSDIYIDSEAALDQEVREMEESRIRQMHFEWEIAQEKREQHLATSSNGLLHFTSNRMAPRTLERDPYHFVSSISTAPIPKVVTLTFDDGPHPAITPTVLDILARYKIKATFFIMGKKVAGQEELMERIVREGHLVANHSQNHPNFHKITAEEQIREIDSCHAALAPYYKNRIRLFRYPYGNGSTVSRNHLRNTKGYHGLVGWHVDTCDWAFAKTGSVTFTQQKICGVRDEHISDFSGHVLATIQRKNGGIVLFHDVHQRTMQHLEGMIESLIARGYRFANLDDPRMTQFFK